MTLLSAVGVYTSLYAYLLINFLFLLFVLNASGTVTTTQLTGVLALNKQPAWRVLFIGVVLALLGTPPTLGFFYKLTIFQCLVVGGPLVLCAATLINLALMVLYLQLVRANQISRKHTRQKNEGAVRGAASYVLLTATLVTLTPHLIISLCDILLSMQ